MLRSVVGMLIAVRYVVPAVVVAAGVVLFALDPSGDAATGPGPLPYFVPIAAKPWH